MPMHILLLMKTLFLFSLPSSLCPLNYQKTAKFIRLHRTPYPVEQKCLTCPATSVPSYHSEHFKEYMSRIDPHYHILCTDCLIREYKPGNLFSIACPCPFCPPDTPIGLRHIVDYIKIIILNKENHDTSKYNGLLKSIVTEFIANTDTYTFIYLLNTWEHEDLKLIRNYMLEHDDFAYSFDVVNLSRRLTNMIRSLNQQANHTDTSSHAIDFDSIKPAYNLFDLYLYIMNFNISKNYDEDLSNYMKHIGNLSKGKGNNPELNHPFFHAKTALLLDDNLLPYETMIRYLAPYITRDISAEGHAINTHIGKYLNRYWGIREHCEMILEAIMRSKCNRSTTTTFHIVYEYVNRRDFTFQLLIEFISRNIKNWANTFYDIPTFKRIIFELAQACVDKSVPFTFGHVIEIEILAANFPEIATPLLDLKLNLLLKKSFDDVGDAACAIIAKTKNVIATNDFAPLIPMLGLLRNESLEISHFELFVALACNCDDPDVLNVLLPMLVNRGIIQPSHHSDLVKTCAQMHRVYKPYLKGLIFNLVKKFINLHALAPKTRFRHDSNSMDSKLELELGTDYKLDSNVKSMIQQFADAFDMFEEMFNALFAEQGIEAVDRDRDVLYGFMHYFNHYVKVNYAKQVVNCANIPELEPAKYERVFRTLCEEYLSTKILSYRADLIEVIKFMFLVKINDATIDYGSVRERPRGRLSVIHATDLFATQAIDLSVPRAMDFPLTRALDLPLNHVSSSTGDSISLSGLRNAPYSIECRATGASDHGDNTVSSSTEKGPGDKRNSDEKGIDESHLSEEGIANAAKIASIKKLIDELVKIQSMSAIYSQHLLNKEYFHSELPNSHFKCYYECVMKTRRGWNCAMNNVESEGHSSETGIGGHSDETSSDDLGVFIEVHYSTHYEYNAQLSKEVLKPFNSIVEMKNSLAGYVNCLIEYNYRLGTRNSHYDDRIYKFVNDLTEMCRNYLPWHYKARNDAMVERITALEMLLY